METPEKQGGFKALFSKKEANGTILERNERFGEGAGKGTAERKASKRSTSSARDQFHETFCRGRL